MAGYDDYQTEEEYIAAGKKSAGGEMDVIEEIAAERLRQIDAEGWTVQHDDRHTSGEMAKAASCYADPSPAMVHTMTEGYDGKYRNTGEVPRGWPWADTWWNPTTRRRDLIKAAALIVAEIERLDRAAPAEQQP